MHNYTKKNTYVQTDTSTSQTNDTADRPCRIGSARASAGYFCQDCNFSDSPAETGLRAQIFGKGAEMRQCLASIELDACRALQARDRSAGSHGFIKGLFANIIQIVAFEQR